MIEFGKTLRDAREAKGLTVAQLAEMTRMPSSRVEALEAENFSGIPAAIYGRGFVRLYCEAVGLDPKPLAAEFTEIYSGNRDLEIRERAPAAASASSPAGAPAAVPAAAPEPTKAGPSAAPESPKAAPSTASDFRLEARAIHAAPPLRREAVLHEPPPVADPLRAAAPADATPAAPTERPPRAARPLSRYAAPADAPRPASRLSFSLPSLSIPPAVWRVALLAAVGLLLLAGLCFGVRALYRAVNGTGDAATAPAPVAEESPASGRPTEPPPKAAKPRPEPTAAPSSAPTAAPRTPQRIPALYID